MALKDFSVMFLGETFQFFFTLSAVATPDVKSSI
jgi:hypothetical protein